MKTIHSSILKLYQLISWYFSYSRLQYQLEVDKMTAFESLNAVKEQLTQEQTWKNDQNEQTQKEMTSLREEIDRLTQDLNSARRYSVVFIRSIYLMISLL